MDKLKEEKGFYRKYKVTYADGSPTSQGADYFVLRLDSDEHARRAIRLYAELRRETNPELAADLFYRLLRYEKGELPAKIFYPTHADM